MEDVVNPRAAPRTFNSALEAGIRAVFILKAGYPNAYDLQRLVAFDYLLVHTSDVGGPPSLHPAVPIRSAELLVRRSLVEQALLLMITRDLVHRHVTPDGISYSAGESANIFLNSMTSEYLQALKTRAKWLIERFGRHSDAEFQAFMRQRFELWIEEFQTVDVSAGQP